MRKKRPNLFLKLAGAFFLLSLIAVGLVGFAVYSQSSAVLRAMVTDQLATTAEIWAMEMDNWARVTQHSAGNFFRQEEVDRVLRNWAATGIKPDAKLRELLSAQVMSRPEWSVAVLVDGQGHPVAVAGSGDQELVLGQVKDLMAKKSAPGLYVFSSDTDRPLVLFFSPVQRGPNRHLGGLVCLLDYQRMERLVMEYVEMGGKGELYLVGEGQLMAHSRGRIGFERLGKMDDVAALFERALGEHPVDEPYVGFSGGFVFGVGGKMAATGWTLVAEMPVNVALAPARRLAWTTLGIGGLLCLLLLPVGFFVSRKIALPIMAAAEMAQGIVSGHLDASAKALDGDEARVLSGAMDRMLPALEERVSILQALNIAKEVQENLLPSAPPQIKGLDIAGMCEFCEATGGDYFDYLPTRWPEGEGLAVIVGDVTGHGMSAALLMTTLRAFLRQRSAIPDKDDSVAAVLGGVNKQLCMDVGNSGRFATLFYLDINRIAKKARWSRAGHDPALVYDTAEGTFEELKGVGLPLGIMEDAEFEEHGLDLRPGQVIVVGTDGLWEAPDAKGELFGKDRLRDVIRSNADLSAREITRAIVDAVRAFGADAPRRQGREDDQTLVVVKVVEGG